MVELDEEGRVGTRNSRAPSGVDFSRMGVSTSVKSMNGKLIRARFSLA